MNIVLIGFRGTGKTEIGQELSKKLSLDFVDIDSEIEKETNKTIKSIFEEEGEEKFRNYEKELTKKISCRDNQIIATGGGIILNKENIENLKKYGRVILLTAHPKTIYERIKNTERPKLTDKEEFEEIVFLLKKRKKQYKEVADFIINTDNLDVNNVVFKIINLLKI